MSTCFSFKTITLIILLNYFIEFSFAQKIIFNIQYVPNAKDNEQLDLYIPSGKNFPTIIYFHEGSLTSGDRKDSPYDSIAKKFQQHGAAFANCNYRLGPDNKWPAQPDDIGAAFKWVKENIYQYGGDVHRIFLVGHSSGAALVSIVGTDEKYLLKQNVHFEDLAGVIAIGTLLNDHIDTAGISKEKIETAFKRDSYLQTFGNVNTLNDACPINHINKRMPKFLILLGESEQFEPPLLEDAKHFTEKAKAVKAIAAYKVISNRKHFTMITKMTDENDEVFNFIMDFIK